MSTTFLVEVEECGVCFRNVDLSHDLRLPFHQFDTLINRRLGQKVSMTTRMAEALYTHFCLDEVILGVGGDPSLTPMVICNRFANWDYVAPFMMRDQCATLNSVNAYVSTAWFPASTQGHLTIGHGNLGEAMTIACDDAEIIAASVESIFIRNSRGARTGAVLLGVFECIPEKLAGRSIDGLRAGSFGCWSVIASAADTSSILKSINFQRSLYESLTC